MGCGKRRRGPRPHLAPPPAAASPWPSRERPSSPGGAAAARPCVRLPPRERLGLGTVLTGDADGLQHGALSRRLPLRGGLGRGGRRAPAPWAGREAANRAGRGAGYGGLDTSAKPARPRRGRGSPALAPARQAGAGRAEHPL